MSRPRFFLKLLFLFVLAAGARADSVPGDVDVTFGVAGAAVSVAPIGTNHPFKECATSMAVLPDGKILVGGTTSIEYGSLLLERRHADGKIDRSFGTEGQVIRYHDFTEGSPTCVAVQPDGKILFAGGGNHFGLARLHSDGRYDFKFGIYGEITSGFGPGYVEVTTLFLQEDGRILLAGYYIPEAGGGRYLAMTRFSRDGIPDSSFGKHGQVLVRVDDAVLKPSPLDILHERKVAVARQTDGKMVLVMGYHNDLSGHGFALYRFHADGTPDADFGSAGRIAVPTTNTGDYPWTLALQPDGKVLVGGTLGGQGEALSIFRFHTNGSADASFGVQGVKSFAHGSGVQRWQALRVLGDGRIVASGFTSPGAGDSDIVVARFLPDGNLDSKADGQPFITTTHIQDNDEARSVLALPDGGILAAGSANSQFAMVKYGGDGLVDENFGEAGFVNPKFFEHPYRGYSDGEIGSGLTLQPDGKIAAVGVSFLDQSLCLARFDADGKPEPTFGIAGKVTMNLGGEPSPFALPKVVIQDDGKVVVSGTRRRGMGDWEMVLARYLADGSVDTSFSGGSVVTRLGQYTDARALAVQKDGCIVVGGSDGLDNGNTRMVLVRHNPDGSLDSKFGRNGVASPFRPNLAGFGHDFVIQPDGKILALTEAAQGYLVARLLRNGSLDTTFGQGGVAFVSGPKVELRDLALQRDGRIVVTGNIYDEEGLSGAAIFRLTATGQPDPSFGTNGRVYSPQSGNVVDLAIQGDGKIVVCGGDHRHPLIMRYLASGRVDREFGREGDLSLPLGRALHPASGEATSLAIQPSGKIVVLGTNGKRFEKSSMMLMRFGDQSRDPVVALTTPGKGRVILGSNVVLSGTASDDLEVARVEVYVNGGSVSVAQLQSNGPTATWSVPVTFLNGSNRVTVSAFDVEGRISTYALSYYRSIQNVPELAGLYVGTLRNLIGQSDPYITTGNIRVRVRPTGIFTAVMRYANKNGVWRTRTFSGIFGADGKATYGLYRSDERFLLLAPGGDGGISLEIDSQGRLSGEVGDYFSNKTRAIIVNQRR